MDRSLFDEYSSKSINFINENYNAEKNIKELLKIYNSIIEGKKISKRYIYK